jgi:hypothetical protein
MNVSHQFTQVPIALTKDRLVPSLQQMSNSLISPVIVLAVTSQQSLHDTANRVFLPLDQQMNVISHQTIGVKEEWHSALLGCEERQELLIVLIAIEDRLAVIAARDYVIKSTFDLHSRFPGHRICLVSFPPLHRIK